MSVDADLTEPRPLSMPSSKIARDDRGMSGLPPARSRARLAAQGTHAEAIGN